MIFDEASLKLKSAVVGAACVGGAALCAPHASPVRAQDAAKPAQGAATATDAAFLKVYREAREKLITKDYAGALPLWAEARKLAQTPNTTSWAIYGYCSALLGLGNIALREKRYDDAKRAGEEVVVLAKTLSRKVEGSAHSLLASVYREQGDMAGLMRESEAGMIPIPGMEELGRKGTANEIVNQISYYALIGDTRGKTLEQIRDALQSVAQDKAVSRANKQLASLGVGNILMQMKQFSQAREQYTKTLAEFGQAMSLKAEVAQKIGDAYAAEGSWDLAVENYDIALENTPERGPRDLAGMADASLRRKRDDAARRAG